MRLENALIVVNEQWEGVETVFPEDPLAMVVVQVGADGKLMSKGLAYFAKRRWYEVLGEGATKTRHESVWADLPGPTETPVDYLPDLAVCQDLAKAVFDALEQGIVAAQRQRLETFRTAERVREGQSLTYEVNRDQQRNLPKERRRWFETDTFLRVVVAAGGELDKLFRQLHDFWRERRLWRQVESLVSLIENLPTPGEKREWLGWELLDHPGLCSERVLCYLCLVLDQSWEGGPSEQIVAPVLSELEQREHRRHLASVERAVRVTRGLAVVEPAKQEVLQYLSQTPLDREDCRRFLFGNRHWLPWDKAWKIFRPIHWPRITKGLPGVIFSGATEPLSRPTLPDWLAELTCRDYPYRPEGVDVEMRFWHRPNVPARSGLPKGCAVYDVYLSHHAVLWEMERETLG